MSQSAHVSDYFARRLAITAAECKSVGVTHKRRLALSGEQLGEIRKAQAEKAEAEAKKAEAKPRTRKPTKAQAKAEAAATATKLDLIAKLEAALAEAQAS